MNTYPTKISSLVLPFLLLRCGPFPDIRAIATGDLEPPMLIGALATSPVSAVVRFSEPVGLVEGSIYLTPTIQPSTVECTDNYMSLSFSESLNPGTRYIIESTVHDSAGNRMKFITRFFGFNARIPKIHINEFITRGSSSHPDIVELAVLSSGNLAGVCIYEGTKSNRSDMFMFPSVEVQDGDYVLVHFKPEGISGEIDETESRTASQGKDASENAWDFWVLGGNGLSGNNGTISLYTDPDGALIDCVIYSNRTSGSDETYRGFGGKDVLLRVDELIEEGGWVAQGELMTPEDAVNPEESTSTRSLCRSSDSVDTDSRADWHIVPTKGSTFGAENIDEKYVIPE